MSGGGPPSAARPRSDGWSRGPRDPRCRPPGRLPRLPLVEVEPAVPALPPTVPAARDASRRPPSRRPRRPPRPRPRRPRERPDRRAPPPAGAPSRRPAAGGASAPARSPVAVPAGPAAAVGATASAATTRVRAGLAVGEAGGLPTPPAPPVDAPEPPAERSRLACRRARADRLAGAGRARSTRPPAARDRRACRRAGAGRSATARADGPRRPRRPRRPAAARPLPPCRERPSPPRRPRRPRRQGEPPSAARPRARCPAAAAGADRPDRGDHAAGVAARRRPARLARAQAGRAPHATEAPADGGRDGDPGCRRHAEEARDRRRGGPVAEAGRDRRAARPRRRRPAAQLVPLPDHAEPGLPQHGAAADGLAHRARPSAARAAAPVPADRVSRDDDERGRPGAVRPRRARRGDAGTARERASSASSNPSLSPLAKPLVEPLRITLDSLDLESISKLWTATTQPLRLSVGYEVSLVVVDALDEHAAGPARPRSPARRRADHGPAPAVRRPAADLASATRCSSRSRA